jgi:hypothetical protein
MAHLRSRGLVPLATIEARMHGNPNLWTAAHSSCWSVECPYCEQPPTIECEGVFGTLSWTSPHVERVDARFSVMWAWMQDGWSHAQSCRGLDDLSERFRIASMAITRLYGGWERDGGVTPSTDDEAVAVGTALGVTPVTSTRALEVIAELAGFGAPVEQLAIAHVMALEHCHRISYND